MMDDGDDEGAPPTKPQTQKSNTFNNAAPFAYARKSSGSSKATSDKSSLPGSSIRKIFTPLIGARVKRRFQLSPPIERTRCQIVANLSLQCTMCSAQIWRSKNCMLTFHIVHVSSLCVEFWNLEFRDFDAYPG